MNSELYAAMCNRFGKDAVREKLAAMGCVWRRDNGCGLARLCVEAGDVYQPMIRVVALPDPVAEIVLCDVAEGMLWGDGVRIGRCVNRGAGEWQYRTQRYGQWTVKSRTEYQTRPACILAALSAQVSPPDGR